MDSECKTESPSPSPTVMLSDLNIAKDAPIKYPKYSKDIAHKTDTCDQARKSKKRKKRKKRMLLYHGRKGQSAAPGKEKEAEFV